MTPPRTRRMKARRSRRVSCGHHVNIGAVIVQQDGRWRCLPCALQAVKTSATSTVAAKREERS